MLVYSVAMGKECRKGRCNAKGYFGFCSKNVAKKQSNVKYYLNIIS